MMYRQGDVLIVATDPAPSWQRGREAESLILAHGEATGHMHVLRGRMRHYMDPGSPGLLQLLDDGLLQHDEHAPIRLDPGWYRVIRQREYVDPVAVSRWVAD